MSYNIFVKSLIVLPEGEPIFSEMATTIDIEDEAAGPFVVIRQEGRDGAQKINIDQTEWPFIKDAIEKQLQVCTEMEQGEKAMKGEL